VKAPTLFHKTSQHITLKVR